MRELVHPAELVATVLAVYVAHDVVAGDHLPRLLAHQLDVDHVPEEVRRPGCA